MGEWNGVELADLTLVGPRLTLRRFRASDTPLVLAAMQDRVMHEFLPLPDPYQESDAKTFVLGFTQAGRDDGTSIESAVVETSTRRLVGAAGLRLPGPRSQTAEIGYATYGTGRGHGYATEAARLLTRWGFENGLKRVQIRAAVGNLASIKAALNAGFRFEGIERANVLTPNGVCDGAVLSRLPGESPEPTSRSFAPLPAAGLSDSVLILRPPAPVDAGALLAEGRDPEVRRWSFTGEAMTEAEAGTEAAQAGLDWLVGSRGQLVMVDAASGSVAGTIVLRLAGPPGVGGIGYGVHPDWRGRGFTARALRLLSGWALTEGGFNRLELGANIANIASQKVARAGGFLDDGIRAGRLRNPDGTYSDEVRFAVVRGHPA